LNKYDFIIEKSFYNYLPSYLKKKFISRVSSLCDEVHGLY
jgi:hypothetical protein